MARAQIYKDPHRTSVVAEKKDWETLKKYCAKRGRYKLRNKPQPVMLTPSLLVSEMVRVASDWVEKNPGKELNLNALVDQFMKQV